MSSSSEPPGTQSFKSGIVILLTYLTKWTRQLLGLCLLHCLRQFRLIHQHFFNLRVRFGKELIEVVREPGLGGHFDVEDHEQRLHELFNRDEILEILVFD